MAHQTGNAVDRKHQCQFCRKKFISLGRKQAHEKLHQTDLPAGSVRSPIELKTVDSTAHSPAEPEESKTLFVCPICDKSFKKVLRFNLPVYHLLSLSATGAISTTTQSYPRSEEMGVFRLPKTFYNERVSTKTRSSSHRLVLTSLTTS